MKVLKLNIYAAVAGFFFLAVVVSGQKTIISAGRTALENSSQNYDGKAVIVGAATIVTKETETETPSAMPSIYPSVAPSVSSTGPSAVPTPVIDPNRVPTPTTSPTDAPSLEISSAAPRTSGMVGMLLLSLLTWAISLAIIYPVQTF
jgi:hypothetical protein